MPAMTASGSGDRRRAPRAAVAIACTLRRRTGSPVAGRTVDLGPAGMCVATARPLAADEAVEFELPQLPGDVHGHARVMREQRYGVYALRFEGLPERLRDQLAALADGPRAGARA
jgi:hypothetical protein